MKSSFIIAVIVFFLITGSGLFGEFEPIEWPVSLFPAVDGVQIISSSSTDNVTYSAIKSALSNDAEKWKTTGGIAAAFANVYLNVGVPLSNIYGGLEQGTIPPKATPDPIKTAATEPPPSTTVSTPTRESDIIPTASSEPPTVTSTPIPSTDIPVPPTDTPIPPTDIPIPTDTKKPTRERSSTDTPAPTWTPTFTPLPPDIQEIVDVAVSLTLTALPTQDCLCGE